LALAVDSGKRVGRHMRDPDRGYDCPVAAPESCTIVIFGASGDLTKRLLVPALYNLGCDGLVPESLRIIGVARDELSPDQVRDHLGEDLRRFSTRKEHQPEVWEAIARGIDYLSGFFEDPGLYARIAARLDGNALFYLATPPVLFGPIAEALAAAG